MSLANIQALNALKLAKKIAGMTFDQQTFKTNYNDGTLTSSINNGKAWNNGFVTTKPVSLQSLNVTTQATSVTVYVCTVSGSNFTIIDTLSNLPVINGSVSLNNYLLNGANYTIFVLFNGAYNYKTGAPITTYQLVGGVFSASSVIVSFDIEYTDPSNNSFDFNGAGPNAPSVATLIKNLSKMGPTTPYKEINSLLFSTSTNTSSGNNRYYSNGPTGQKGYLQSIKFQNTNNPFSIVAGTVSSGSFVLSHTYGTFTASQLDTNGVLTLNDSSYMLEPTDHIFIQQYPGTFNFAYGSGGGPTTYQMDSNFANLKTSGVIIGFNVTLASANTGTLSIADIEQIQSDIATLQSSVGTSSTQPIIEKGALNIKSYMKVYGADFSTTSSDWSVVGGTASAWTVDTTNKQIYPTVTGGYSANALQNVFKLNKRYECDMKILKFDVTLHADTVLNLHIFRNTSTGQIPNESLYLVDIPNNQLAMTTVNASTRTIVFGTYSATKALGFPIVDGNTYQVEIEKMDYTFYLRLKDYVTGNVTELKFQGWDAGTQLSYYGFSWGSGGTAPKISNLSVWMPKNPTVAFVGDSITEGWLMHNLTGDNSLPNRFAEKARLAIGNSVISAASSGTINDVISKFDSEYSIYKPQFLFVTIGTNGGTGMNTASAYQQLASLCQSNGITLILNHIPAATPSTIYYQTINGNIDTVGAEGCKFDVATSTNNLVASGANASVFADGVHPNYAGSVAMFNRIQVDVPEILY